MHINQNKALTETPSLLSYEQLRQSSSQNRNMRNWTSELNFRCRTCWGNTRRNSARFCILIGRAQVLKEKLPLCKLSRSHLRQDLLVLSMRTRTPPLPAPPWAQAPADTATTAPPPEQRQLGRTEHVCSTWHHSGGVWGRCSITLPLL